MHALWVLLCSTKRQLEGQAAHAVFGEMQSCSMSQKVYLYAHVPLSSCTCAEASRQVRTHSKSICLGFSRRLRYVCISTLCLLSELLCFLPVPFTWVGSILLLLPSCYW